jgi:hypothetical protein
MDEAAPKRPELDELRAPEISADDERRLDELLDLDIDEVTDDRLEVPAREVYGSGMIGREVQPAMATRLDTNSKRLVVAQARYDTACDEVDRLVRKLVKAQREKIEAGEELMKAKAKLGR